MFVFGQAIILFVGLPSLAGAINFSVLLQRKFEAQRIRLFMGSIFIGGPWAEIICNRAYGFMFGHQLWQYRSLPIAGGDTSWLAILIWPMYGLNMYLVSQQLKQRASIFNIPICKGLLVGVEGPFAEVLCNGLSILFLNKYIFYYFPSDCGHLTSVQVVPIYVICGSVASFLMGFLERFPLQQTVPFVWLSGIISLLVIHLSKV